MMLMLPGQGPFSRTTGLRVPRARAQGQERENPYLDMAHSLRPFSSLCGGDHTSDPKLLPCHKFQEGRFYMLPLEITSLMWSLAYPGVLFHCCS